MEEATKEHREALQQELSRVVSTANGSNEYATVSADTHPEVAACEKAIEDILQHEKKDLLEGFERNRVSRSFNFGPRCEQQQDMRK